MIYDIVKWERKWNLSDVIYEQPPNIILPFQFKLNKRFLRLTLWAKAKDLWNAGSLESPAMVFSACDVEASPDARRKKPASRLNRVTISTTSLRVGFAPSTISSENAGFHVPVTLLLPSRDAFSAATDMSTSLRARIFWEFRIDCRNNSVCTWRRSWWAFLKCR